MSPNETRVSSGSQSNKNGLGSKIKMCCLIYSTAVAASRCPNRTICPAEINAKKKKKKQMPKTTMFPSSLAQLVDNN